MKYYAPSETLADFVQHLADVGLSANTLDAYSRDARWFVNYMVDLNVRLDEAEPVHVDGFIGQLGKTSKRTVARKLSAISRLFRWLVSQGRAIEDPTTGVARPKIARPAPAGSSHEQIKQLLESLERGDWRDVREGVIVLLITETGLTVSQIVALQLEDVAFMGHGLVVTRRGERVSVYVSERVAKALCWWLNVRTRITDESDVAVFTSDQRHALSRQACWKRLKSVAQRAGLPREVATPQWLHRAYVRGAKVTAPNAAGSVG